MYSFTKAKEKPFFAEDTKLWLIFIGAVMVLMLSFTLLLLIKSYIYHKNSEKLQIEISENNKKIIELTNKINFINEEKIITNKIIVDNTLLKDSVKTLLNQIPDPITLTYVKIEKNSLYLYGITPRKEIYNNQLLQSLKSIFTTTTTNFYQMDNGYYRFESINSAKELQ